jgi:hypothetical protein
MISYRDFNWKKDKCFLGNEYIGKIVEDQNVKGMFWIEWPDHIRSNDFYNKTRAKDNLIKYVIETRNTDLRSTKNGTDTDVQVPL